MTTLHQHAPTHLGLIGVKRSFFLFDVTDKIERPFTLVERN
jgi:hypothetical protein